MRLENLPEVFRQVLCYVGKTTESDKTVSKGHRATVDWTGWF